MKNKVIGLYYVNKELGVLLLFLNCQQAHVVRNTV